MLRVQDIMTTNVVTVTPTTTLRDAAELFAAHHIGGAPVVDGTQVVGVVSTSDILTFAASAPKRVEEAGDDWEPVPDDDTWDGDAEAAAFFADRWAYSESDAVDFLADTRHGTAAPLDGHTVSEVMTPDILSLAPGADVSTAAERMRAADVHRLLVMDAGGLVGIVSTTDLARAVADRRVGTRTFVFGKPR